MSKMSKMSKILSKKINDNNFDNDFDITIVVLRKTPPLPKPKLNENKIKECIESIDYTTRLNKYGLADVNETDTFEVHFNTLDPETDCNDPYAEVGWANDKGIVTMSVMCERTGCIRSSNIRTKGFDEHFGVLEFLFNKMKNRGYLVSKYKREWEFRKRRGLE